eukprot:Hpha_TRINITY_DN22918_c0_g1::TRINITY_DN22918_c0_g1_i1::g.154129::m.154129
MMRVLNVVAVVLAGLDFADGVNLTLGNETGRPISSGFGLHLNASNASSAPPPPLLNSSIRRRNLNVSLPNTTVHVPAALLSNLSLSSRRPNATTAIPATTASPTRAVASHRERRKPAHGDGEKTATPTTTATTREIPSHRERRKSARGETTAIPTTATNTPSIPPSPPRHREQRKPHGDIEILSATNTTSSASPHRHRRRKRVYGDTADIEAPLHYEIPSRHRRRRPSRIEVTEHSAVPGDAEPAAAVRPKSGGHEFSVELQRYRETVAEQSRALDHFREVAARLESALRQRDGAAESAGEEVGGEECADMSTLRDHDIPTLTGTCLRSVPASRLRLLGTQGLFQLGEKVLMGLSNDQVQQVAMTDRCKLLSEAVLLLSGEQCGALPPSCTYVLSEAVIRRLRWDCFTHFSPQLTAALEPEQLVAVPVVAWLGAPVNLVSALSPHQCSAFTPEAAAALRACKGIRPDCLRAFRPAALAALKPRCARRLQPASLRAIGGGIYSMRQDALSSFEPEQLAVLGQECDALEAPGISNLSPQQCAALSSSCMRALRHSGAITPACASALDPGVFESFSIKHVRGLRPDATAALGARQLSQLAPRACTAFTIGQVRSMTVLACAQLRATCASSTEQHIMAACGTGGGDSGRKASLPSSKAAQQPVAAYSDYGAVGAVTPLREGGPKPLPPPVLETRGVESVVVKEPRVIPTPTPPTPLPPVVVPPLRLSVTRMTTPDRPSSPTPPVPERSGGGGGRMGGWQAQGEDSLVFVDAAGSRCAFKLESGVLVCVA